MVNMPPGIGKGAGRSSRWQIIIHSSQLCRRLVD